MCNVSTLYPTRDQPYPNANAKHPKNERQLSLFPRDRSTCRVPYHGSLHIRSYRGGGMAACPIQGKPCVHPSFRCQAGQTSLAKPNSQRGGPARVGSGQRPRQLAWSVLEGRLLDQKAAMTICSKPKSTHLSSFASPRPVD
ncbi:hypothetical protein CDAR_573861 [Caerostris darwini]|uniref:Uncharacterized protein n=1 Tax=Caerostris darwini TaxID=1538125 RepID=A0AAV4T3F5_9ARAC|nr:hypothetical protein CDAR_573861 [Caerostris darwini]